MLKQIISTIPFLVLTASAAYGQEAGQPDTTMFNIIFFSGFALIFYFLLWRPQSKRAKEHKELMSSLGKGDEVMTSGGFLGKINKVDDLYVVLEVADNIELKVQKSSVAAVLPKGTIKSI